LQPKNKSCQIRNLPSSDELPYGLGKEEAIEQGFLVKLEFKFQVMKNNWKKK